MDILRRIFAVVFPGVGLGVIGRYLYNGVNITTLLQPYSYIVIGLMSMLLLGFLIVFGVFALPITKPKLWASIGGLIIVLLGYGFFVNDATKAIYIGDILTVLGVILTYLSLAGLIVSKKAQEKLKESKQIVIEV